MLFNGVVIGGVTYRSIGKGVYNDAAATLTSPATTLKVNPGAVSPVSKGNPEKRRTLSWVVTKEFAIASPSEGQPSRQKTQIIVTVMSGIDVPDSDINTQVDQAAAIPDSGRLVPMILGAS